ncbi:MAG: thiamine phosphate synthase [Planctomycetales bacterium]|nr:thiamine phosphate synthase [Planctomycetales bacterium]
MNDTRTIRILDASTNRAVEGLRVVEDYVRFALDDGHLTRRVKELRHELAGICDALPRQARLAARETRQDVGTEVTTPTESRRTDAWDVCLASLERTKQSLRSLEEYSKVESPEVASQFETLRYRLYTLERALGITFDSCQRLHDVRLCVLIDAGDTLDSFRKLVAELLAAGVGMIQLREKRLSDRQLIERARVLKSMITEQDLGALMIVNDRADIAAIARADGVHLGQDDVSVKDARTIIGPRKLIGVSTHSLEQARAAVLDGANYLGAGPTFPSTTKAFDNFPGLDFLKQVASEIRLPTFAIGGINAENLEQVLATGTMRVALSGAIVAAPAPGAAANKLLLLLEKRVPQ